MADINIKAPRGVNYNITVTDSFDTLSLKIGEVNEKYNKICILTDKNVANLYAEEVKNNIADICNELYSYIVDLPYGVDITTKISDTVLFLNNNGFNENDAIIALGGGVVTDYSSIIAAEYNNGIDLINVPTSITSMVDTAIDGKSGYLLGYFGYNNKTIKHPRLVYVNTACAQSLDARAYFAGFAHVMKTAIVKSSSVYEWLIEMLYEISDRDSKIVSDMIEQSIMFKKIYIEKDPMYVKGDLMLMDLGTTVGYALYKVKYNEMKLGECLALGIIAAAHISMKREMLSLEEYLEIRDMFVPFNLPISIENIDVEKVINLTHEDIKVDENGKCFILLKKIGKAVIDRSVSDNELKEALMEIRFSDDDFVVE